MRYRYDTVGEGVLNPDFNGWAAGRIEIWDSHNESGYPFDEIRYFVRWEEEPAFRDFWDNFESEWPIFLGSQVSNYNNVLNKEYSR